MKKREIPQLLRTLADDPFVDYDPDRVLQAATFAKVQHGQQRRSRGTPYFVHLHDVAARVSRVTLDTEVIQAAYLHDVVEDTSVTLEDVIENFGPRVGDMVRDLTLPEQHLTHEEKLAEQMRAMANTSSVAVLIIKAADKLSNTTALRYSSWPKEWRVRYADAAARLIRHIRDMHMNCFMHTAHGGYLSPEGHEFVYDYFSDVQDEVNRLLIRHRR